MNVSVIEADLSMKKTGHAAVVLGMAQKSIGGVSIDGWTTDCILKMPVDKWITQTLKSGPFD